MREVLSREEWTRRERAHQDRVSRWTEPFLERRSRGEKHPVEDFLFTYYTLSPAQFTRWHPGPGVVLLDAPERADWKFYRPATVAELAVPGAWEAASGVVVDADAFLAKRETAVKFTREILANTAAKSGTFDCFGLHEWAMAYRAEENGLRHENAGLRLGASGTDAVVEGHRIRCSHFDAFRFFQPQAVERNELQPTREAQRTMEQPGCLHASMDLYKWAYKLLPAVDSELLADCFELAWDVRVTDMEASPYDLADWGYEPVRIETPEGKAEYVRRQRAFAARGTELRHRLVSATDRILAAAA
ncbi:3-methyladenine DNA glycosylase [Kocuria rhizophila]|uniref:3-methyladenine DNA glycosylase n=1 Tax=Kocuria rhizophila TaxID=72000 RepID=UPI000C7B20B9|nr:3-methyladenine DNA glycosylase [Kocuria rhizophila]PKZ38279.1 3-methyladenine DNA glycosylase [Kocuria rhizophila]RLP59712.1 3-methyladenine DNA glycosylase [Kocuria rhizophila]